MKYKSQIGVFPIVENIIPHLFKTQFGFLKKDYRKFYTEDETDKENHHLGGFEFLKNEHITSHAELFAKYQLFINRNGINCLGTKIKALSTTVLKHCYYVKSYDPIFVGDTFAGEQFKGKAVSYAEGTYLVGLDIWDHIVTLDSFEDIKSVAQEVSKQIKESYHPFHNEMIKSMEQIRDAVVELVRSIKTDGDTLVSGFSSTDQTKILKTSLKQEPVDGSIASVGVTRFLDIPQKNFQKKMNNIIQALEKVKT